MQLSAVYWSLYGAICGPSQLTAMFLQALSKSMIVITTIFAMIAVCRTSTDVVIESEELDAPNKLFQMCQAVVQRYYMHGRSVNPGSAACGPWVISVKV